MSERVEHLRKRLAAEVARDRTRETHRRLRRRSRIGELAELAGVADWPEARLLGAMAWLRGGLNDRDEEKQIAAWEAGGRSILQPPAAPVLPACIATFPRKLTETEKALLRRAGLVEDRTVGLWRGRADSAKAGAVVDGLGGILQTIAP